MKSFFIGNLPYDASEESVAALFAPYGEVDTVKLVGDRDTGVFRGFAFLKMQVNDLPTLLAELDNKPVGTQRLIVDEIQPKDVV